VSGGLGADALRAFVLEDDPQILRQLFELQTSKRLIQLELLRRQLNAEAPALSAASGFDEHVALLRALPADCVRRVASYPSFGALCATAYRMVSRGLHLRLPKGEVEAHLGRLGASAAAAAVLCGHSANVSFPFDHLGRSPLPGTGLALEGPLEFAGHKAQLRVEPDGSLVVDIDGSRCSLSTRELAPGETRESGRLRLRRLPRPHGIEVNDVDLLLERNPGEQACDRLDERTRAGWTAVMQGAMTVLEAAHPGYLRAVADHIAVLVPLASADELVSLSSSSEEAFGCVRLSFSPSPETQAEALVHEYHHNKLYALLDYEPLLLPDLRGYSPWKDAPRPAVGLLHGIFAFQAVAELWAAIARRASGELLLRAQDEHIRRVTQIGFAVDSLRATGALTEAGRLVLDALLERLERSRLADVPPARAARALAEADAHFQRTAAAQRALEGASAHGDRRARVLREWELAGGRFRAGPRLERLVPQGDDESAILTALGCADGVAVNCIERWSARLDPSFDMLGRMYAVDRTKFEELAERVAALGSERSTLASLLRGHVAYVSSRFEQALRDYACVLLDVPHDVDVWRDVCFCLRHLRCTEEADLLLFSQETIVAIGQAILPDRHLLERVVENPRLPSAWPRHEAAVIVGLLLRFAAKGAT
jgi:HEXXH motif-containing protein